MIATDTNVISKLLRGTIHNLPNDELFVPFMVMAELRTGVAAGDNPKKNHELLDRFFSDANVTTSPGLTPEAIACYAQIYTYLRRQGTPISPNDLWIAAECMQLSLPLLTHDSGFKHVPQVILA